MEINITTPILLFPTMSLILLAYTEKFVQLARLLRQLKDQYKAGNEEYIMQQVANLKKRIYLIRNMQAMGTISLFLSALSSFFLFIRWDTIAHVSFWTGLICMMSALVLTLIEVRISARALQHHLKSLSK